MASENAHNLVDVTCLSSVRSVGQKIFVSEKFSLFFKINFSLGRNFPKSGNLYGMLHAHLCICTCITDFIGVLHEQYCAIGYTMTIGMVVVVSFIFLCSKYRQCCLLTGGFPTGSYRERT